MVYFAIYWVLSAVMFLRSRSVNEQVQMIILRGIVKHINDGKLNGASIHDIERIANSLSLIFTIIIVIVAPFFLAFNLCILTLQLLKNVFLGFKKKDNE